VNESIENGEYTRLRDECITLVFAQYLPQQYDDLMQQVVLDEISATITHAHMKYAMILYYN
jgi:hypothetical protein